MDSLSVSKFKATCLAVVEEVARSKKPVIITKRGKPVAELIPYEAETEPVPLKDTVAFMGDIISPVAPEDWEALQ
ncbi:MAG: type II toxin-antitoxin system Phd/YefM family antitoxin [Thermodesulfobacteriota bacterium]